MGGPYNAAAWLLDRRVEAGDGDRTAIRFLGESVTGGIALGGALILVGAVVASLARPTTMQEQQVP